MSGNPTPTLTPEQFTEPIPISNENTIEYNTLSRFHFFALGIIGDSGYNSPIFDEEREKIPDLVSKVKDAFRNHDWRIPSTPKELIPLAKKLYQQYLIMGDYGHSDEELNLEVYM